MTVSEARARLPFVLELVERGEQVTLTRHGRAVAVVVRPDALRSQRVAAVMAQAREIGERLERARTLPIPEVGLAPGRAEELIAEIRAGRDAR
jgi:antitoxin (DNA-binding transcriptional repressor) of toxin-antitoxin stability system